MSCPSLALDQKSFHNLVGESNPRLNIANIIFYNSFYLDEGWPGNTGPVDGSVDDDREHELQGGHDQSPQQGDEEVQVGDPGSKETGETDQAQPGDHLPPDPVSGAPLVHWSTGSLQVKDCDVTHVSSLTL